MKYFFFVLVFVICIRASSQVNIDFEAGNPSHWYNANYGIGSGNCGSSTPNNFSFPGFNFTGVNVTNDNHGICCCLYTDPNVTNANIQIPYWGNYSARLGDVFDSCGAAQMTYSLNISSGGSYGAIAYALVLHDNHADFNAPKFYYTITDGNGNHIDSVYYDSNSISTDTSFHPANNALPGLYYKNWHVKCYDFTPYIGMAIYFHFVSSDCNDGNHRAYAYLDLVYGSCVGGTTGTAGIDQKNEFLVYPNPASDHFTVSGAILQNEKFEINLYDPQGKIVLKENLENFNGQKAINVENLVSGIYFLTIISKESTIRKKLIINK